MSLAHLGLEALGAAPVEQTAAVLGREDWRRAGPPSRIADVPAAGEGLAPGLRLGGFVLQRLLGRGGTATVWLARVDPPRAPLPPAVVLKVLDTNRTSPKELRRFEHERRVLSSIESPFVARFYELRLDPRGLSYLVLEAVPGLNLAVQLALRARAGHGFDRSQLREIVAQVGAGLTAAHQIGVVHRDLKPHNLVGLIEPKHVSIKVLDFGIARLLDTPAHEGTTVGRVLGSHLYMAPEQIRGAPVDPRADVFALGTILFELLTLRRAWGLDEAGRRPLAFASPLPAAQNSPSEIFHRIQSAPRPRVSEHRPELAALDALVARATASTASDRYPSVSALLEDFARALEQVSDFVGVALTTEVSPAARDVPRLPVSAPRVPTATAIAPSAEPQEATFLTRLTHVRPMETLGSGEAARSTVLTPVERWIEQTRVLQTAVESEVEPILPDELSATDLTAPRARSGADTDHGSSRPRSLRSPFSALGRGPAQPVVLGLGLLMLGGLLVTLWRLMPASEPAVLQPLDRVSVAGPGPAGSAATSAVATSSAVKEVTAVRAEPAPEDESRAPPEAPRPPAGAGPSPREPERRARARAAEKGRAPNELDELARELSRLEEGSPNPGRITKLSNTIRDLSARVEDPAARTRIRRLAESAAMFGDLSQLQKSAALLQEALRD